MAAGINDKLRKYKSLFSTTLSGGIGTGTSDTITPSTVTGLPTDTAITLTFDRKDSSGVATPTKLERIRGIVSGGNFTAYVRAKDGTTEQAHTGGAVIEMVWNADDWNDMVDWGLTEHDQDGTHSAITATSIQLGGSGATVTGILDEDTMSSNSATKLATQQSIKAYIDNKIIDDDTMATASATTIPTSESVKAYVDANASGDWKAYTAVVPTRASADDPTYVLTFAAVDLTSTIYAGMRIKWTQNSTVRYAIVTKVEFSTNTTMTVYGGTDYDVDDTATHTISAFSYSSAKAPAGFPLDPTKWTVEVKDTSDDTQSSPTVNTWYNLGPITLDIPIGVWRTSYDCVIQLNSTTSVTMLATLSDANNTESDKDYTTVIAASHSSATVFTCRKEKILSLTAKDTYYLNARYNSGTVTALSFLGSTWSPTIIRAICAYL